MAPIAVNPGNVDYLSYQFNQFDLHSCWKFNTKHKDSVINGRRLENASWRKFFQMKFNLKTADPSILNWQKDNDVCWLYGPFFSYEPLPVLEAAALEQDRVERASRIGVRDMDIGYGYGHHAIPNSTNYTAQVAASTNANMSIRSALKKRKEKDDVWQALRERYIANGGNLRPEDLQAFSSRDPSPPAPTGRGALFYLSDFPLRHAGREGIPRVTSETWTSAKWDRKYDWDDNGNDTAGSNSNNGISRKSNISVTEESISSPEGETSPDRGRSTRSKSPRLGAELADASDSWNKHIRFADNVQVRVDEEMEEEESVNVNDDEYSSSPDTGVLSDLTSSNTTVAATSSSSSSTSSALGTPSKMNVVALKLPELSESESDDEPDYFVAKSRNSRNSNSSSKLQRTSFTSDQPIAHQFNNTSSIDSSITSTRINHNDNNSTLSNDNSITLTTNNTASSSSFSTSISPPLIEPAASPTVAVDKIARYRLINSHTAEDSDDEGIVYVNVRKSPNLSFLPDSSETPLFPAGPALPAAITYANSSGNLGGLKRTTSTGKLSLALQQATQVQQERLVSAPVQYANMSFDSLLPPPGSAMSSATFGGSKSAPSTPPYEAQVNPLLLQQLKYVYEQTGQEPHAGASGSNKTSVTGTTLPSPPPSASTSESVLLLGTIAASPDSSNTAVREDTNTFVEPETPEEAYTVNDRVNDVVNNAYEVIRWAGAALSNLGIF